MLGEEPGPGLLELRRRPHVGEREPLAQIDLRDRDLRVQDQLLADVLHAAVVVVVERGCRVGVYPLVVDLQDESSEAKVDRGEMGHWGDCRGESEAKRFIFAR